MDIPETPDKKRLAEEPGKPAPLETDEDITAVRLLLTGSTIEDIDNKRIINNAVEFLENPTEKPEETLPHLLGIGMILAMNYGEIEDQPPVLNEINHRLFILISEQHIKIIESELKKEKIDTEKIDASIKSALNFTGVLVKSYSESVLRNRVIELQEQLESM